MLDALGGYRIHFEMQSKTGFKPVGRSEKG